MEISYTILKKSSKKDFCGKSSHMGCLKAIKVNAGGDLANSVNSTRISKTSVCPYKKFAIGSLPKVIGQQPKYNVFLVKPCSFKRKISLLAL